MAHVHYKFSSKLSYDTVLFDSPHITLKDLKRQIMSREKLRAGDCDLQVSNAQSKEEYTDDEGLIPKGSSVIVRRIPIIRTKSSSSSKTRHLERSDVQAPHAFGAFKAMGDQPSSKALPFLSKMANLAHVDVSEEDKLNILFHQSKVDSMNYSSTSGAVLPANYSCYRCGNTGHHIRNCPSSRQDKNLEAPVRIKKSTGIPRSFMVEVDDPSIKGAMLTNCGRYAIPAIDAEAYAIGKKERPPFIPPVQPKSEDEEDPFPGELVCLICHDLLSDAVVIPCCGNSYCDDCIRTTLLDSEDHICPTCSQPDVSPDTLIANRFLRQAVENFKKERSTKSLRRGCGASQSQNPTPTPSPVPTPPPPAVQSQPQKPHPPTSSQQDPLLQHSQAADTPPSSQACGAPPTTTGPDSPHNMPSTSLQPAQSHLEIPDKAAEEKTHDESAAAASPSVPVSPKDSADPPSQLIPPVNLAPVVEQPQTVSVNLQQPSTGPAPGPSGPSACWESSSSSSRCPTGGWNESNTQQRPPSSSSYQPTPPPLFPSPHFHTYLAAQQPLSSYPPGYPPTTPVWALPNLQGAPIPSLCPSATIPALIPKEWYRHERKKKERSPHRGSSHKRSSSSRSTSESSKSKSSRSYSRSSSRSRSRSRSRGRSRPHSPYSRHRNLHTRSHSSRSYSYGYKRSPTPSSSSSPRMGHHSSSKSPSDHRKNSHHSRHHSNRSASSSHSSRRKGEQSQRETSGSGGSLASYLYAQHANQTSSLELDREHCLQWKREYKEWCDKYFSSYVSHFHQLPLPLLSLPPPPPQWGNRDGSSDHSHANSDPRNQLQPGGRTAQTESRSSPSQSSSDSRSPPSQSSCDSRSAPSQSSSDSHTSPSHSSSDGQSPPSQSSSDGRSTPSEDGAQTRAYQQRCTEKYSRLPVTLTKSSKDVELQEGSKDDKQLITKSLVNLSTLKHEQESMKKHESSSPDAADSTDGCRKDTRMHNTGPNACKDGSPAHSEATASDALELVQPLLKPDTCLDKDYERKSMEQRNLEIEKGWRGGKHSDSRQDVGRQHREKPSEEASRVDTDRGSRASDSRSENRKRKGEDTERSSVNAQSSKCQKTKIAEDPNTCKSFSPNPFDRTKPKTEKKKERKTCPLTERDIWEGGMKVRPQKKISININLEGKSKEEKTEKRDSSYLESFTGKTKEESEEAGNGEEEKLNGGERKMYADEKKESSRDMEEEKIKPEEGEARQKWEKATFRDDTGEMLEKTAGHKEDFEEKKEDFEMEDFDLWLSALRGVEEEDMKTQCEEGEVMEASNGGEVTNDERSSVTGGKEGQETERIVAGTWKEQAEGESTWMENKGNSLGKSKAKEELMEGVKCRMRKEEEEDTWSKSQRSRNESHHDRPDMMVDDGSSYKDHQERKRVVKTLEQYTQDRAADRQDQLVLIQVPHSKWEKEKSEEEEQDEGGIKVQTTSVSVTSETPTNRETGKEEKRERSVEMERGRHRDRDILASSHRSVAPSSGKDRTDSALCTDRDGEKRMEVDRRRDRERGSERSRDRQQDGKRSKHRTREEEKGRDRERERERSSIASAQRRNPPSSSHSYSYLTSRDTERRDRHGGGDPGGSKSSSCPGVKFSSGRSRESSVTSRATEPADQKTHKSYRDTFLDSKFKDAYYRGHQDPLWNYRTAGTHHSPPSLSHSQGTQRDSLSPGSEVSKPRMSGPDWETMENRRRNEVKKWEWELRQVINEGKGERENQEMVCEREGNRREDKGYELDGQIREEKGRELEEGERPSSSRSSSVSSSASQENVRDDERREKKKKQKKHTKEKRRLGADGGRDAEETQTL